MATPLSPPQHQNPRRDRQQELDRLQDAFDLQTGRKSKPTPWHTERASLSPQSRPWISHRSHKRSLVASIRRLLSRKSSKKPLTRP